jgi:hypothetical protein
MSSLDEAPRRNDPSATMSGAPDRELELTLKQDPSNKQSQVDVGSDDSMDASDPLAACQPGGNEPAPCNDFPGLHGDVRREPALEANFDIQGPDENGFCVDTPLGHADLPGLPGAKGGRRGEALRVAEPERQSRANVTSVTMRSDTRGGPEVLVRKRIESHTGFARSAAWLAS